MSSHNPIGRVLVADDDPNIVRAYCQRLSVEGYEVGSAADAAGALALATQQRWDVILIDVRMPGRAAADAVRLMRSRRELASTPIWLLALPGDADLVDQCMRAGADGSIDKSRTAPRDLADKLGEIQDTRRRAPRPGSASVVPNELPPEVEEVVRRFRTPTAAERRKSQILARESVGPAASPYPHLRAPEHDPYEDDRSGTGTASDPVTTSGHPARDTLPPQRAAGRSSLVSVPSRPSLTGQRPAPSVPAHAPPPPPPPPPQPAVGYDVVLNRVVGQPAQLAAALGFRHDFTCPICGGPLVLRLCVDESMEYGVRGYFHCPGCAQSA